MKKVTLAKIKADLPHYLRLAEDEEIVITRQGKPVGLLLGFQDEIDWDDYLLVRDPRFIERVRRAREDFRAGKGIPIEQVWERLDREVGRSTEPLASSAASKRKGRLARSPTATDPS